MKKYLAYVPILLAVLCAVDGFAASFNVADYGDGICTKANFESAYAAASANDTIVFPLSGTCTWTDSTTISKSLTINGNGTTLTAGNHLHNGFFYITNFISTDMMRITGFVLNGVDHTAEGHGIRIGNTIDLTKLRIDHNTFHFFYEAIDVGGSFGVIDNNHFYNSLKGIAFTAGSTAQAAASWVSMAAGTANALFIEDNHFIDDANYPTIYCQEKIGTDNGGKIVVRYNEFDFDNIPAATNPTNGTSQPFMAHGSAAGGVANGYWQIGTGARRGQSVIEFYENTMHAGGKKISYLYVSRGGANLVYNNHITGTVANAPRVYFYEEETYVTSNWPVSRSAWPAEDQVHNSFIWGNTYNGSAYFNQSSHVTLGPQNSYCTEAGFMGATVASCCTGAGTGNCNIITENQEYFLHAPAATGGKASFTGLNGGSATAPTDGTTYPTLGNMTFSEEGPNAYYDYTPYQYPHPLRGIIKRAPWRIATP